MPKYKNHGKDSDVKSYEAGPGELAVTFGSGDRYTYTSASATPDQIAYMKRLALNGQGLGSYINRKQPKYSAKTLSK